MTARRRSKTEDWLFPALPNRTAIDDQSSLLDVVDSVLNKGAVVNGDVVLGVAKVDLIYAKLSVLLAALDRVIDGGAAHGQNAPRRTRRRNRTRRSPTAKKRK
jgi:Gas vesicle protein